MKPETPRLKTFSMKTSSEKTSLEELKLKAKPLFDHISSKEKDETDLFNTVSDIVKNIKQNGDNALLAYTEKFDNIRMNTEELLITPEEIRKGSEKVSKPLKEAVKKAIYNIQAFHKKQIPENIFYKGPDGEILESCASPMENAGLYIPGGTGGKTPLISTLIMNAVPAQIAGCSGIFPVTPPSPDKKVHPAILYTMRELGLQTGFKAGGAQAIAALACGTETIAKCDIIVGPGNKYVAMAKKIIYGTTAIDGVFGPSEIIIIADGSGSPELTAADLISQSEHAGDEMSLLITTSPEFAESVQEEILKQIEHAPRKKMILKSLQARGAVLTVSDIPTAATISNLIAPEHLELSVKNPQKYRHLIKHAGAVFIGEHAPEPIGDYICGTNHVLPTNGCARFASPLGVYTFLKRTNFITYNQKAFDENAPHARILAETEGLFGHAASIIARTPKP